MGQLPFFAEYLNTTGLFEDWVKGYPLSCVSPNANPKNRMEAITSRPKQLSAVGRITSHSGQNKILPTVKHESVDQIKLLVANVRSGIRHISAAAPLRRAVRPSP